MNCLLIGLGNVGFKYDINSKLNTQQSHFTSIINNKKFKNIYLLDKNKKQYKQIKNFNKELSQKIIFLDKLPLKISFNLIIIATTTSSHFKFLKKIILNKMTKNIICEKPFTENLDNSNEILRLSIKNNIRILINYHRRYLNIFNWIKNFILKKKINKIQMYYSKGIYQNACHFINLIIFMFGKPKNITVLKRYYNKENNFVRADFIITYNKFKINCFATSLLNTENNKLAFYYQNGKLILKNKEINLYIKKKEKYELKKKNNQLQDLLIENLQNYQYYVLNNFFINRNYKKNLKEAVLTDKILNKIANEKTSY